MKMRWWCAMVAATLILAISCSDSNTNAPSDQNAHPASWRNPAAANHHGVAVIEHGSESCKLCHGTDLNGSGLIPGCRACHFDASGSRTPSESGWIHAESSHNQLIAHNETCNKCHDIYRQNGLGPAACHDCHAGGGSASHPVGSAWLLPSQHAQASINDRASCLACHDMQTGGSGTQPACRSCHTQGNPPLSIGNCSSCHRASPNSGEHGEHDEASCNTCHRSYGTGSLSHYYPNPSAPADVRFRYSTPGDSITYSGGRCSGTCHFGGDEEEHESERW